MDRKEFLRTGCITCIGMALGASLLQSCAAGGKYVKGTLNGRGLLVNLSDFETGKTGMRPYLIVRHDAIEFPLCVYHIEGDTFTALLMRCTHQGAELQAAGDQLTCQAHGSEFDRYGTATQGPATLPLRSFPVSVANGQVFIDLRKQS
ncbi:Rieske (2Fe-2S) protein [Nemorincola caseinilytica]|uniref:Rieske (2Fe-2S) protein n=1 Tax=Nemorincola caseinilytica TaxID=2054315 RepID=A0ABP8NAU1_9BACT